MIEVRLHGILDTVGKPIKLSVSTAAEASTAVMAHLRRTSPELFKDKLFFQIRGFDTLPALSETLDEGHVLDFMPAMIFGKKAGLFQVALGAILVVGGVFIGVPPNISLAFYLMAGGLILGGLIQMLTPVPKIDTQPEVTNPEASKYISASGNTTKIGTRIPLAYGTFPIYGHFLSINTETRDLATGPYSGSSIYPYNPNYRYGYPSGTSIREY